MIHAHLADHDLRIVWSVVDAQRTSDQVVEVAPRLPGTALRADERGVKGDKYMRMTDRREAIARAIDEASDDDVIVIAGKGHESYQVIGDQIVHFDDREEAELALKKRHEKLAPKIM